MPSFSKSSRNKLNTCHEDLQLLFNEVIKHRDCTIIYGHRSVELQQELFAQGRTKPGKIVTHLDGVNRLSKHNYNPSLAVDVVPYFKEKPHIRWDDIDSFKEFGNFVLGVAKALKEKRFIENDIQWGGNWFSFPDMPHYQLKLNT